MQLVHTSHAREGEHVNNIMVTVTLQAAVSHRGSGIWHYELCRNVQNTEEIQHSSGGTNRDLVPSQWHQPCMQIQYTKQWSPAIITLGEENQKRKQSLFCAFLFLNAWQVKLLWQITAHWHVKWHSVSVTVGKIHAVGMAWFWIILEYFNTSQKQFPVLSCFLFFPSQIQVPTHYVNLSTAKIYQKYQLLVYIYRRVINMQRKFKYKDLQIKEGLLAVMTSFWV